MNASYSGRPISDTACCSRLAALPGLHLGRLLGDQRPASSGDIAAPKYSQIVPRLIGIG